MSRILLTIASFAICLGFAADQAAAQSGLATPLDQGFKVRVPAFPSGAERTRQSELWMLDVELKPMRMRYLEIEDAKTGQTKREQVWYLIYRVFNRPIRGADVSGSVDPVNALDTPYTRPMFAPELTLVTYDDPADEIPSQTIVGDIVPQAIDALRPIEERQASIKLNGPISALRPLPEAADDAAPIYGVAIFRNVDPDTDFFKVIFRGFTNVYEIRDDANGKRIWRKVLVQRFKRPGDRFDPNQREFDFAGDAKWIYIPDSAISNADIIAANDEQKASAVEESTE